MTEAWKIAMMDKAPGKALIRMASGKSEWMHVMDHVEAHKNKIEPGALVRLQFTGDTISFLKEVDVDGKDKDNGSTPSKYPAKSSGGGWKKADPAQEWVKNQFILHESLAPRALDVYAKGVELGWTDAQIDHAWDVVLYMTIRGARKITAEIQGGMKV